MTPIILVRHAEPEQIEVAPAGHWTDTVLSELGRRQAACVAARLGRELAGTACRLCSSDLKRALETAEAIGQALGAGPPERFAELREFNGGLASGGSEEELRRTAAAAMSGPEADVLRNPRGESWAEFRGRVAACMEQLTRDQDRPLIVVSHYGTGMNIVSWWLNLELNAAGDTDVSFGAALASVTVLYRNPRGKPTVERLNDTSHLAMAGMPCPIRLDR